MKLHHYGFATKLIEESLAYFEMLGYTAQSDKIIDSIQGVQLLFINNGYDHLIELVAPIDPRIESPVSRIIKKNGSSIYHICYEVENIESSIQKLEEELFITILPPTPAIAFGNRKISFLYNKNVGLIELLEAVK